MHILITLPWSGRVLLWLGMGRCIITENSWLTSPLPPKRLNDREVRVGWYDTKKLALESESQDSTLSLITEGVEASKLWFHHYPMMTTPNTSGHCRHILAAWAIWAPEAPHITGRTLPAVAHSGKHLAVIVSQPEDEEASKIFQNILTEPQHA